MKTAIGEYGAIDYKEIDILDPMTASDLRGWGSPTILVNGSDITGQPKGDDIGCRVYPGEARVPTSAEILSAIREEAAADVG